MGKFKGPKKLLKKKFSIKMYVSPCAPQCGNDAFLANINAKKELEESYSFAPIYTIAI